VKSESVPELRPESEIGTSPKPVKPRKRKPKAVVQQHIVEIVAQDMNEEQESEPVVVAKIPDNQSGDADTGTKRIVEAILFAANRAMTVKQIREVFPEAGQPEAKVIQAAIDSITLDYEGRPIGLAKLASGYRFQIQDGMAPWVSRLFEEKPPRYSRALLETLAIIAYRQPVTRGEIEDIRGVGVSSQIIRTLLDREWIRVIAHKEVPGRPALYGTTKQLLDYFNLASLDQLPTMDEITDVDFDLTNELNNRPEHSEEQETSTAAEVPKPADEAKSTDDQEEVEQQAETDFNAPQNSTIH
jgi:segregation and condensation protein B